MNRTITNFLLLLLITMAPTLSFATNHNEHSNMLSKKISGAHTNNVYFSEVSLFTPRSVKNFSFLNNAVILTPIQANISKLYADRPTAIMLPLTAANGKQYTLEMIESFPIAGNGNFGVIDQAGRHQIQYDKGLHYQGAVQGMEKSLATMSVFADGTVMILFANEDGNFNLGALEDQSSDYVMYNDRDMLATLSYPCAAEEIKGYHDDKDNTANKTTGVATCRKVQLYWECDYGMYQDKGSSTTTTQNYLTGLFNQKQAMYFNEDIAIELKSLYIWTIEDFFKDDNSANSLYHFREYWNTMNNAYDGDYAQLIAKDPGGRGGISFLDVLCTRSFCFGYADINGSYQTVPTYSWDVEVVTHETGHALGSKHTHWCGWNTGTGGTCGSIDDCYTQESGSSCSTCSSTFQKSNTSWKGTVMSYCHLVSGKGIDLANGFGPLPGNQVRTQVGNATCLKSIIDADLVTTDICNNDGSVTVVFNSGTFSDTPYTYTWVSGQSTQDITGLSTAGTYTVTITDSNSCSNTFATTVNKQAKPGDADAVQFQLPLCCKDTSFVFSLTADLTSDLSTCQTVAWLRTPTAVTSYADAKAAFDTIGSSNILLSTNAASIDNSTAATLDIASPNPCDSLSDYYYTPFITRTTKAVNTITSSTLSSSNISAGTNTVIGRYAIINDQSGVPTACDLLDTPTVHEMNVTISNYSGRDTNLTIVIIDVSGREIHRKTDYLGNGTYTIQLPYNENLLKTMTVQAFDFNCSDASTCVSSSLTLTVQRIVTYPAVSQITFAGGCTVGKSVQLSFAPDNCTNLNVPLTHSHLQGNISVYPNPASNVATLDFDINRNGIGNVRVVDITGKTIHKRTINYYYGNNKVLLDLSSVAKGVYFVTLQTGAEMSNTVKLTVE